MPRAPPALPARPEPARRHPPESPGSYGASMKAPLHGLARGGLGSHQDAGPLPGAAGGPFAQRSVPVQARGQHGPHAAAGVPEALVDGLHCCGGESLLLRRAPWLGLLADHAQERGLLFQPVPRYAQEGASLRGRGQQRGRWTLEKDGRRSEQKAGLLKPEHWAGSWTARFLTSSNFISRMGGPLPALPSFSNPVFTECRMPLLGLTGRVLSLWQPQV